MWYHRNPDPHRAPTEPQPPPVVRGYMADYTPPDPEPAQPEGGAVLALTIGACIVGVFGFTWWASDSMIAGAYAAMALIVVLVVLALLTQD